MKNSNYKNEMTMAHQFIINNGHNGELRSFIHDVMYNTDGMTHSDRWSMIYDWMQEHYPEATGSLITGLCYYCEQ